MIRVVTWNGLATVASFMPVPIRLSKTAKNSPFRTGEGDTWIVKRNSCRVSFLPSTLQVLSMLRRLFRLFLRTPEPPGLLSTGDDRVVLYAHVAEQNPPARSVVPLPPKSARRPVADASTHRERLLGMRLEHVKICRPRRCERLAEFGILTCGDLARANPDRVASHFSAPRKAAGVVRRYRRAIRLASAVPGMMPRDALLLVSIHRRSVRGLAAESPSALHRDLERYAESTKGRQQLRGRRVPSTRRLRRWIAECESLALHSPIKARVA